MGTVPMDVPDHFPGSRRMPRDSPGKLSPVLRPNPNARRYRSMRSLPSSLPTRMEPTLDELAMMSVIDHCTGGWGSCSLNTWSATLMVGGTFRTSWGRTSPSSRAAEMVITLFTEPGSNTSVTARFFSAWRGGPPSLPAWRLARASTSPVRVCMTMAVPALALDDVMRAARARSVSYWRARSMVSTRSSPRTDGSNRRTPPGMSPPRGSRSTIIRPGRPASRSSYWLSRPERPLSSVPTRPRTGRARPPAGRNRSGSSIRVTPGRFRASTRSATPSSTRRAR